MKETDLLEEMLAALSEIEKTVGGEAVKIKATEVQLHSALRTDISNLRDCDSIGDSVAKLLSALLADAGKTFMAHALSNKCSCVERDFVKLDFLVRTLVVPLLRETDKANDPVNKEQMVALLDEAFAKRLKKFDELDDAGTDAASALRNVLAMIQAAGSEKH